jgi:hypothetical protein
MPEQICKFKNESTDEIFDRYSWILKSLLDRHAPYTNKKPRRHLLTPWFDAVSDFQAVSKAAGTSLGATYPHICICLFSQ